MPEPATTPHRPGDRTAGQTVDRPARLSHTAWLRVARRVQQRIGADNVSIIAGGVAFFALLALFPALAALVAVYGLVVSPEQVTRQITALSDMLPAGAQSIVTGQLERLAGSSSGALGVGTAVGVIAALWSASKGTKALVGGLGIAYHEPDERGFFQTSALVFGLTAGIVLVTVVGLALIAVVPPILGALPLPGWLNWPVALIRWPILLGLILAVLALLYAYGPDRSRPDWRWTSPGAWLAAIGWIGGSLLFSLYVRSFGTYSETYGAITGVVVLMLWLYLSAFLVLIGALVNAELERRAGGGES